MIQPNSVLALVGGEGCIEYDPNRVGILTFCIHCHLKNNKKCCPVFGDPDFWECKAQGGATI